MIVWLVTGVVGNCCGRFVKVVKRVLTMIVWLVIGVVGS